MIEEIAMKKSMIFGSLATVLALSFCGAAQAQSRGSAPQNLFCMMAGSSVYLGMDAQDMTTSTRLKAPLLLCDNHASAASLSQWNARGWHVVAMTTVGATNAQSIAFVLSR